MKRRTFLKIGSFSALALATGGLAWRVGGVWWDQDVSPDYRIISGEEADIIASIADAMFPGDGTFPNANELGVVEFFDGYLTTIDVRSSRLLRVLLHAIDDVAALADFGMTRFRFRPRNERIEILNAWDNSFFFGRRGAFRGVKLVISTAYCEHPDVLAAAQIDFACGVSA